MTELYLGREYKTFYYKYYPKTKEESFCFVDVDYDYGYNYVAKELAYDEGSRYPLGYLLSKCVCFYEKLRIESLEKMREFLNDEKLLNKPNVELRDIRNGVKEYYSNISYVENKDLMFYVDRRRRIFEEVFTKHKFLNGKYEYENNKNYDCLELFSFFLLNDIYEIEELPSKTQKEMVISLTFIFDFIERCLTKDYEFCSYDNLCVMVMNNQDNLDNGYTVFENKGEYHDLNTRYYDEKCVSTENELCHLYKVEDLKSFLYVTLQEIFKNNHVIKRCEYCQNIFVPLIYKSNKYCRYRKYETYKKSCYEIQNSGIVVYKEKHDRCEKIRKQIRDRLNKWTEYYNGPDENEHKYRESVKNGIYHLVKELKKVITDENEFYSYLVKIKDTNIKIESEYHKLQRDLQSILETYKK